MPENNQPLIIQLKKLKLFQGLDEAQLERVAAYIHPLTVKEGESLHLDGKNCPFFIVVSGKAGYTQLKKGNQGESYILKPDDFFGADAILRGRPRSFTLLAHNQTMLFSIQLDALRVLLNTNPLLTKNIKKQLAWYNLVHSKPFSWLGEDETVKVVCRKHPAYLLVLELAPLVMAWVGLLIILAAAQIMTASFRLAVGWLGAGVVVMAGLWAIWRFFDWGNDYYVITDQRIVWLERTIGLYDSRQEAPLVAIKSGETKSGAVGQFLGFGDVITETFMGQIFFRHIGDPGGIKNLIEQEHKLAVEQQVSTDIHGIEGKIRQKIEPSQAVTVPVAVSAPTQANASSGTYKQELRTCPKS